MISILTVSHNGLEWLKLFVASVRKFSSGDNEIVVVDNCSEDGSREWLKARADIHSVLLDFNLGHGRGADIAVRNAANQFCLILDSDAHILRPGFEADLLSEYESAPGVRLVAAKGGPEKPVHPCAMFFERDYFLANRLSFVARDGYDVGRKILPDIEARGHEARLMPVGYEANGDKFYPGARGDTYYLKGRATVYHQWYASRMWKKKQVDNLTREDFERHTAKLFAQPFVRQILAADR